MSRATNPDGLLKKLNDEEERLGIRSANAGAERTQAALTLRDLPTRIENAVVAHLREADGEDAEELRKLQRTLEARIVELDEEIAALERASRLVGLDRRRLYSDHLEHFAALAEAASDAQRAAATDLLQHLDEATDAWRAAAWAWQPVIAAARDHGLDVAPIPPDPFQGLPMLIREIEQAHARPRNLPPDARIALNQEQAA